MTLESNLTANTSVENGDGPASNLHNQSGQGLPPDSTEPEDQTEHLLPNTNIITHCIYRNDPRRLVKSFDEETDPYHEDIVELLNVQDNEGKTPLDLAACLGRLELTRELLTRGADIAATNPKGYSCLHYAAAWGRLSVLKVQVENGGNLQVMNVHNERPKEVAQRYYQEACVNFLDWAEAKSMLQDAIRLAQESILDADKAVAGRITKEEKNISLSLCKEKQEWMNNTQDATTQDFISQRLTLNEIVTPVIQKLSEPPPTKDANVRPRSRSKSKSRPSSSSAGARPKSGKTTGGAVFNPQKGKKKGK